MPEMYRVVDVDSGRPLRPNRYSDPRRCLAHGYAYAFDNPGKDFVVIDESGRPVPGSRIKSWSPFAWVRGA